MYLVFFVADPVDDALAGRVVERVRALVAARAWNGPSPGWFDDPAPSASDERTTGGYLRTEALAGADVAAVWGEVVSLSADEGVEVEVQWREEIVGRVRGGAPDPALQARFAADGAP